MKDNILRGCYQAIDFNDEIIIKLKDKAFVKATFDHLIHEKHSIYKFRYAQGFLDVDNPEDIGMIPKLLDCLQELVNDHFMIDVTVETWIMSLMKLLQQKVCLTDDLLGYTWELLDKFETKMYFKDLKSHQSYIVRLFNTEVQYLFELPQQVKGVIYVDRPSTIEIDILDAKHIHFIVTKDKFKVGSYYKVNKIDLGILPSLGTLGDKTKTVQRGKFKLGLNINSTFQIPTDLNIDPDFIMVEPEKAYIPTSGIVYLDQRQTFYKRLFDQYPDSEIIVSLPKLMLLDIYFNQGSSSKLDYTTMLNHQTIYEIELSALLKYKHPKILLSLPDIESVEDFDKLKRDLETIIKKRFKRSIPIGLDINNEFSASNLQHFKRYSHVVINLNKRFDVVLPKDIYGAKYSMSYSDIRNILYRKSKDAYLVGQDIHHPVFLQKMIYRGFKNFAVKPELFDLCNMIIYRYNQGERLYAKSAKNNTFCDDLYIKG